MRVVRGAGFVLVTLQETLKGTAPDYGPIVLMPGAEEEVRPVAELVEVLR